MICPNCGNDNASGRSACAVCGAELRADLDVLEPIPPPRTERDDFEDSLWPPPTVFVLEDEEEVVLEIPPDPSQFDDAQADDVFEQSLSGLKLDELEDESDEQDPEPAEQVVPEFAEPAYEVEPVEEEAIAEPAIPEPEPTFPGLSEIRDEAVPFGFPSFPGEEPVQPQKELRDVVPTTTVVVLHPEPVAETQERTNGTRSPSKPQPQRAGKFLRMLAAALLVALVFAAGAASGFWYAVENAPKAAAVPEIAPPQEAKPDTPAPPEGMVFVEGGNFLMGSDDGDELSRPAHFVSVGSFFIDRTEVTNEAYRKFISSTGYDPPPTWKDGAFAAGEEEFPVTGVTWYDAAAYAVWAGKRLPTEAEWEFAARGRDGRKYPWGNDWDPSLANVGGAFNGLRRVGEGAATPLGILDMAGNAWEWTSSDATAYPGSKGFPWSRLKLKIIRGGNWKSNSGSASATFRGYYGASGEKDYSTTSFRCVKDIAR